VANAHFVTEQVAVGGELDTYDEQLAIRQLAELVELGITHILDVRQEWNDEDFVAQLVPGKHLLHASASDLDLASALRSGRATG